MRVLVTGGTGLIGRHIVGALLTSGAEPVAFDISKAKAYPERSEVEVGDILDLDLLVHVLKQRHVNRIIHCAAVLQATCEENPAVGVAVNVTGTMNVLEAAQRVGVERVVLTSSIAVYGRTRYSPMDEQHPCEPQGIYGTTKLLGEQIARAYERTGGLHTLVVRYGLVYGPGGIRTKGVAAAFRSFLETAVRERVIRIPAMDQRRSLTYVSDAAEATVLACVKSPPPAHRVFNVAGRGHTMSEAAGILCSLYPGSVIVRDSGMRPTDLNGDLDTTLAHNELGFTPAVSLEDGLRITCASLDAAGRR